MMVQNRVRFSPVCVSLFFCLTWPRLLFSAAQTPRTRTFCGNLLRRKEWEKIKRTPVRPCLITPPSFPLSRLPECQPSSPCHAYYVHTKPKTRQRFQHTSVRSQSLMSCIPTSRGTYLPTIRASCPLPRCHFRFPRQTRRHPSQRPWPSRRRAPGGTCPSSRAGSARSWSSRWSGGP